MCGNRPSGKTPCEPFQLSFRMKSPKSAIPLRQSFTLRPDHHTKSSKVAGWRLWKYLCANSVSASSRLILAWGFILLAVSAYVAFMGNRSPLQIVPDNSAKRMWYDSLCSSMSRPFSVKACTKSSLVALPLSAAIWASIFLIFSTSSSGMLILLLFIQPLVTAMALGAQSSMNGQ